MEYIGLDDQNEGNPFVFKHLEQEMEEAVLPRHVADHDGRLQGDFGLVQERPAGKRDDRLGIIIDV